MKLSSTRALAALALTAPLLPFAEMAGAEPTPPAPDAGDNIGIVHGDNPFTGETFMKRGSAAGVSTAAAETAAVNGSQPWVNLLCAFPDEPARSRDLAYFESLFGGEAPQLDNYWREVSYGKIDVVGSRSSDWKTLPKPRSAYLDNRGEANLGLLQTDCTRLHDPAVDFSNGGTPFVGINMAFNGSLGCCAWGGGSSIALDGPERSVRVTWLPPFGYENQGVYAHEMGHGFGLPHSDNTDGDDNTYDSPWDVMSAANGLSDPTYGEIATHPVAAHKIELGWYAGADVASVPVGTDAEVTLEPATSTTTGKPRAIEIPITGGRYVVEVRELTGAYDAGLPGTGAGDRKVIISKVSDDGGDYISRVVDADNPPDGGTRSEGVQWRPGETFIGDGITIRVLAQTSTGMTVSVDRTP
jgi:hypothetical protein